MREESLDITPAPSDDDDWFMLWFVLSFSPTAYLPMVSFFFPSVGPAKDRISNIAHAAMW